MISSRLNDNVLSFTATIRVKTRGIKETVVLLTAAACFVNTTVHYLMTFRRSITPIDISSEISLLSQMK